ncbi:MAG: hypothetical protein PVG25_04465 [Anaerolineae bacterium]
MPPIAVEVIVENADQQPFFRGKRSGEIPSGPDKPYCTAAGTYKVRGNGRTLPLLPARLLAMFMASENQEFVERFKAATTELEQELADTKARLMQETERLLSSLKLLEGRLEPPVALNGPSERDGPTRETGLAAIEKKLDALLEAFEIEGPSWAM